MIIENLLTYAEKRRRFAAQPEMDPLTEAGALQEAQLLDVRLQASTGTVALLLDLRVALQLRAGDTGLLVAHGVAEFDWSAKPRRTRRTAWNIVGSEPRSPDKDFLLELYFVPDAKLSLRAASAEFYVGEVAGLCERPPDYVTDSDEIIEERIAGWSSPFTPVHAAFLDPSSS